VVLRFTDVTTDGLGPGFKASFSMFCDQTFLGLEANSSFINASAIG